ncbi:RING-H2 finger protein ATL67-like [Juglans regia]|uniref:RING-H2 finger protein ATL67-like n=1 Tax=Juglans regia TaxID=51240 RepID=A0A2I4GMI0_JUGRE|nr:RING-H2 finger protein ATL67-like [Juglans regia]
MSTPTTTSTNYLTNIGLGYAIAIALGFLVLLSTLLLASYLCCRSHRSSNNPINNGRNNSHNANPSDGIILPRIIFVAEDEDGETLDENVAVGIDQSVINSYPKFPYYCKDGNMGTNSTTCSICLCEYKDSEMLRMMPECRHYFHLYCIDPWLKLNGSCPVCRNSPLPTPLSTPLSEVVPLSQYAADRWRRR